MIELFLDNTKQKCDRWLHHAFNKLIGVLNFSIQPKLSAFDVFFNVDFFMENTINRSQERKSR